MASAGSKTNGAERVSVHRVVCDRGIDRSNAIWSVLLALEQYRKLCDQVPQAIHQAVGAAIADIDDAAEGSREPLEELLALAVAATTTAVMPILERRRLNQWVIRWSCGRCCRHAILLRWSCDVPLARWWRCLE